MFVSLASRQYSVLTLSRFLLLLVILYAWSGVDRGGRYGRNEGSHGILPWEGQGRPGDLKLMRMRVTIDRY